MKNFMVTFEGICEFVFLEAPLDSPEQPIKFFVDRGIPGPYKIWLDMNYKSRLPTTTWNKTQVNFGQAEVSLLSIVDFMNS